MTKTTINHSKEYYIDLYNQAIEEDKQYFIKENGNDDNWCSSCVESDLSTNEIVGYYLVWYQDEALQTWLENLSLHPNNLEDKEVTRILIELLGA